MTSLTPLGNSSHFLEICFMSLKMLQRQRLVEHPRLIFPEVTDSGVVKVISMTNAKF